MIIEVLLGLVYDILDFLLFFEIPSLPDMAFSAIEIAKEYILGGAAILNNFAPLEYMYILFVIVVAVDIAIGVYKLVMWILKKIPMVSIT